MTSSTTARRAALRRFAAAAAAVASFSPFLSTQAAEPQVLRVSAIPDEAPTELQRKFKPLGEYLSQATGMKVVFTPVTDYAAVVESLATRKLDLAWLGGFTYVQARIRTGLRELDWPALSRAPGVIAEDTTAPCRLAEPAVSGTGRPECRPRHEQGGIRK